MKSFCKLILNENEKKRTHSASPFLVSVVLLSLNSALYSVVELEKAETTSTSAQWFIDILFITRDSRMFNKLCEKSFTV